MLILFGVRALAGYYLPNQRSEQWVAYTNLMMPYPANQYEVVRYVGLMEFLGIATQEYELEFKPAEADRQLVCQQLARVKADAGPYVCIHAGGISGRRWLNRATRL